MSAIRLPSLTNILGRGTVVPTDNETPTTTHKPAAEESSAQKARNKKGNEEAAEWRILTPFVPNFLIEWLSRANSSPIKQLGGILERASGAILFLDIKGFTTTMERMWSERGNEGVEKYGSMLNDTFGRHIEIVHAFGGDVIQVIGDALFCLFRIKEGEGSNSKDHNPLLKACAQAAKCSLELAGSISKRKGRYGSVSSGGAESVQGSTETTSLSVKIVIAAGELVAFVCGMDKKAHIGSSFPGRKFFFLAGRPLQEIAEVDKYCESGDVMVTKEVWNDVGLSTVAMGVVVANGAATRLVSMAVERGGSTSSVSPSSGIVNGMGSLRLVSSRVTSMMMDTMQVPEQQTAVSPRGHRQLPVEQSPELVTAMHLFVPYAVRTRLLQVVTANPSDGAWAQANYLGEFRCITAVFVRLKLNADFCGPAEKDFALLDAVQRCTLAVQKCVYRHEGSVQGVFHDEKGWMVFAAFGVPPYSHVGDALRGALAAVDIQAAVRGLQANCSIGISTNQCFCSLVGNERRCVYSPYGDSINLAARLATLKGVGSGDDILCDHFTFEAVQSRLVIQSMGQSSLKGKSNSVEVYRVVGKSGSDSVRRRGGGLLRPPNLSVDVGSATGGRRDTENWAPASPLRPRTSLVGSVENRKALDGCLADLCDPSCSTFVTVIEGDAGFGKSLLIDYVTKQARHLGVSVMMADAASHSRESTNTMGVWSQILVQLLEVTQRMSDSDVSFLLDYVLSFFDQEDEVYVPLLHDMIPQCVPDYAKNPVLTQLNPETRAKRVQTLFCKLIRHTSLSQPKLIVIKGAQFFDQDTWDMLNAIAKGSSARAMLLLSTRPSAQQQVEYERLLKMGNVRHLHVDPLTFDETRDLTIHCFDGADVPNRLIQFLYDKCQGNPFFTVELAKQVRELGLVKVEGNAVVIEKELNPDVIPGSMYSAICSRLDRLPIMQQLVLKVGSVIGKVFSYDALCAIFPVVSEVPCLRDHVLALERTGDLVRSRQGSGPGAGVAAMMTLVGMPSMDESVSRIETWIFKHNVLYEVSYSLLTFAARSDLHCRVATWLEQNKSLDFQALAWHFSKANAHKSALLYLEKAGDHALATCSYMGAIDFFKRALEECKNLQPAAEVSLRQACVYRKLGDAFWALANLDDAKRCYEVSLDLMGCSIPRSPLRIFFSNLVSVLKSVVLRLIGSSAHTSNSSDVSETPCSQRSTGSTHALLRFTSPRRSDEESDDDLDSTTSEDTPQHLHVVNSGAYEDEEVMEPIRVYSRLVLLYSTGSSMACQLYSALYCLVAAHRLDATLLVAKMHALLSVVLSGNGYNFFATHCARLAEESCTAHMSVVINFSVNHWRCDIETRTNAGYVAHANALLHRLYTGLGNTSKAQAAYAIADSVLEELGEYSLNEVLLCCRGAYTLLTQKSASRLTECMDIFTEATASATARGASATAAYGQLWRAYMFMEMNDVMSAAKIVAELEGVSFPDTAVFCALPVLSLCVRATCFYRSEDFLQAEKEVKKSVKTIGMHTRVLFWEVSVALGFLAEVCSGLLELAEEGRSRSGHIRDVVGIMRSLKEIVDCLGNIAKKYPMAESRYSIAKGLLLWHKSAGASIYRRRAVRLWEQAVDEARQTSSALDEACAQFLLATRQLEPKRPPMNSFKSFRDRAKSFANPNIVLSEPLPSSPPALSNLKSVVDDFEQIGSVHRASVAATILGLAASGPEENRASSPVLEDDGSISPNQRNHGNGQSRPRSFMVVPSSPEAAAHRSDPNYVLNRSQVLVHSRNKVNVHLLMSSEAFEVDGTVTSNTTAVQGRTTPSPKRSTEMRTSPRKRSNAVKFESVRQGKPPLLISEPVP